MIFIVCHDYKNAMRKNTINKAFRQTGYDTEKDLCGHIYSRSKSSNDRVRGLLIVLMSVGSLMIPGKKISKLWIMGLAAGHQSERLILVINGMCVICESSSLHKNIDYS